MDTCAGSMIKLSTTNYSLWKPMMTDFLYCKDLYDPIKFGVETPLSKTDDGWEKLRRKQLGQFGNGWNMQTNTAILVDMVRQQFKRHMHETDPEKIQKLKDDAARGLINHILHETEKLSGHKLRKRT